MMPYKAILAALTVCCLLFQCCQQTPRKEDKDVDTENLVTSTFKEQTFLLKTVEDLYDFLTYDEHSYPLVSAHRGGPMAGYPENAIETFEYVANKMPAIIECDIRLTKDSVMVLMHDEKVDRTTNGTGYVNKLTLDEIKKLRLKDNEGILTDYRVPTLQEALTWGRGKVIFTLDVKKEVRYQDLNLALTELQAAPYVIIITYNTNQAIAVYRTNPELMISVSVKSDKDLNRLSTAGIPDNKLVAFVGSKEPDSSLVNTLHSHGIKIILGTIGNLDRQAKTKGYQVYADYIVNGADIISTDRPIEAYKALDYYIRKRDITSPYIND